MVMIIDSYDDDDDESVEDGDVCKFGTGAPSSVRGAQNLHSSVGKRRQRRTQLAAHWGKSDRALWGKSRGKAIKLACASFAEGGRVGAAASEYFESLSNIWVLGGRNI